MKNTVRLTFEYSYLGKVWNVEVGNATFDDDGSAEKEWTAVFQGSKAACWHIMLAYQDCGYTIDGEE